MNRKNNLALYLAVIVLFIAIIAYLFYSDNKSGLSQSDLGKNTVVNNFVGNKAPDFSLQDINGKTVTLDSFKGKNVILFFNEGQMCYPACWNQIDKLGNDPRFNSADTVAFSIVVDTPAQWKEIESEMPQFKSANILFDVDRTVSSRYGVLSMASSMHPGSFPGHTYFVIDKNGIIQFFLDDPNMAIRNDQLADEINKLK